MVTTPAENQTRRMHPLRANGAARWWWATEQSARWATVCVQLWALWAVVPAGATASLWWVLAVAGASLVLARASRWAQWQAWTYVPGAHAVWRPWLRPKFEFSPLPDRVGAIARDVVVAAGGVYIAVQSLPHAVVVGFVGGALAFMGAARVTQWIVSSLRERESLDWFAVACESSILIPAVAWTIAGDPTANRWGGVFMLVAALFVFIGKVAFGPNRRAALSTA